jgi:hypothetical protein
MTAPPDPIRVLGEEVAALRRDLTEIRSEVAHLIAARKRQFDSQQHLLRMLGKDPGPSSAIHFTDEVTPLWREVTAMRGELAQAIAAVARQDDSLQHLRQAMDKHSGAPQATQNTEEVAALRRDLTETRSVVTQLIAGMAQQDDMIVEMHTSQETIRKSLEATQGWLSRVVSGVEEFEKRTLDLLREVRTMVEKDHHTLYATAHRVDLAGDLLRLAHEDTNQLREAVTQCIARLDEHQTTLGMWIGQLADRVWPNAQAFHEELERIFPQGFSAVPYHRLAPKKSDG